MKRILLTATVVAAALCAPAWAADAGISVGLGQPGFYGRLDMAGFPSAQVTYSQPVSVERVAADRPPIYLRVPPGQARHWLIHCHEYNACGERVLFVQDHWYTREYAPRYREMHRIGQRNEHRDEHRGGRGAYQDR